MDEDGTVFALPFLDHPFNNSTSLVALNGEDGSVAWQVALNFPYAMEVHGKEQFVDPGQLVPGKELIYVNGMASTGLHGADCLQQAFSKVDGAVVWSRPCHYS